jgi:hypothetical protein
MEPQIMSIRINQYLTTTLLNEDFGNWCGQYWKRPWWRPLLHPKATPKRSYHKKKKGQNNHSVWWAPSLESRRLLRLVFSGEKVYFTRGREWVPDALALAPQSRRLRSPNAACRLQQTPDSRLQKTPVSEYCTRDEFTRSKKEEGSVLAPGGECPW